MNTTAKFSLTLSHILLAILVASALALVFPSPAAAADPVITGYDIDNCYQGQVCNIQMQGNDPDPGDVLVWSLDVSPAGMAINANTGLIAWTPTQAQADTGDHNVEVRLTDAAGGFDQGQFTVHAWRTIITTHFRVRWWAPDGNVTQAYAQNISTALENSWNVEVNNLGYLQPPNTAGGTRIDVYIHDIAANGSTSNATATDPPRIEMDIGLDAAHQEGTSAHEFYHAIQAAYDWGETWIDEASATWMTDRVYDNANYYPGYVQNANALLAQPATYMPNTYNYGGMVFPLALSEYRNDAAVRQMWEGSVGATNFIAATITALGSDAAWRSLWQEFARRNYDTSRYSEGNLFGVRAALGKDYTAAAGSHYIYKDGTAYLPHPSLGIKIDAATFPKYEGTIPGLATFYLRFQVPAQVLNGNTQDTRLFLYFDGNDSVHWSVAAYGVFSDGTIGGVTWQLVDPNNDNAGRTGSVSIPVGGNGASDYREVIVIIANTDTANTNRDFKLSGALVPVFQGLYVANADTSTTTTVKNLGPDADANNEGPDEDNVYKNGDTIEIEIDLSDVIHKGGGSPIPRANRSLKTDFTAVDSNATPILLPEGVTAQLEEITETSAADHKYKIKYVISASNAHDGKRVENVPVKLEVQDFSQQDDAYKNKDETFKITVDNEPPKVSRVVITQGPKTIYDSQGGISEWAKAGTIQVKVIFDESMQTDEANGTDVDATVKFGLNAPFTANTVTRSTGWSTTTKKNDTWTGQFTIPANQGTQFDGLNTLSITARDQAGNWLDSSVPLNSPTADPDTSHRFKIDSTLPVISFDYDFTGDQECPNLKVSARAADELNGVIDPAKVSGLKLIRYIVNPPGGWQTINNPSNPHNWTLATIPAKQSVTYQVYAEDLAGNTLNKAGGMSNNFPGCDNPDENLSVASPYNVPLSVAALTRRVDPQVAVLNNGFALMTQGFLGQFGEPSTLVGIDFDPAMVDAYPVLVIPSGGLNGIDTSPTLRARLETYTQNGGTIIAFDQQHGVEYAALPGAGVSGYGWAEDNSCFLASLYISEYHQILSGFSQPKLTSRVDGFFTAYPPGTLTPLNRTQNGFPGLIMYPHGAGWVVATTIYDDFGLYNRQGSGDSFTLARDLVSWALAPAQLPEYDPGVAATVPVTLTYTSNTDATGAVLTLLNPAREVVATQAISVSVAAGGQQVIDFDTTTASPLGIWWIDYTLKAGGSVVQDQTRGGRFVVSDPPPSSGPGKELGISVTAPNENFVDGSLGRFTFHVVNFTDQPKDVEVRYGFPHHTWETGDPSYGNFSSLSYTLTVPAAIPLFGDPSGVALLPGEATFTHDAIMRTTDRLFAYLYYNGQQVDQNWFKIWEVPSSVLVSVTPEQPIYTRGETGSAQIDIDNLSQAAYTVTVGINLRDARGLLFHQEVQTATLQAQSAISLTTSFAITATANAGMAQIEAFVRDLNGSTLGSGVGSFEIPPSPLKFSVTLPETMIPGTMTPGSSASVAVHVTNSSPLLSITGASLAAVLRDPSGGTVADLGNQVFSLPPGGSTTLDYPFTPPDPTFGDYRFHFTVVDAFGTRAWDEMASSKVSFEASFAQASYRVRETLDAQAVVANVGKFVETLTVTVSSEAGSEAQLTTLSPGEAITITTGEVIPGALAAGSHPFWVAAEQATGGSSQRQFNYAIAESRLAAELPVTSFASGGPITVTVRDDGGADTSGTYSLELTDWRGNSMFTSSGATGAVLAGGSTPVTDMLPGGLADGPYLLDVSLTDSATTRTTDWHFQVTVSGLSAQMANATDAELYLSIDPITATVVITNTGGDILSGTLTMQVIGPRTSRTAALSQMTGERRGTPNRAAEDGPPSNSAPPGYQPTPIESSRSPLANDVLVLMDSYPWNSNAIQQVLSNNGISYDQLGSAGIPTVNLDAYKLVIIASDQPQVFYNTYNAYRSKFEDYARNGGIIEFHAAAWGWNGGSLAGIPLPGGVNVAQSYQSYNSILEPDHPLVAGVPDPFYGNSASHSILSNLPPEALVIAVSGSTHSGQPTLVEYPLGDGWVIAASQTLEHGYTYGYPAGQILINMIPYAYNLELMDIFWEWSTPITLTSGSVTTVITPVVPMTATGKLYLRSWLDSALDQELGRADPYPFYVFPGLTMLTVGSDQDFYAPGATMNVSGLALNARSSALFDVRASPEVTLTSRLTVTLNGSVVYTEGPFDLPPAASHPYSFATTAPIQTGRVEIVAIVDDITGTVRITDSVQIVAPEVDATFDVPAVVGQLPFSGTLTLENTGFLPATLDYALYANPGGPSPVWSGQATLGVGQTTLLNSDLQVMAHTAYTLQLSGDVTQTLPANVTFGEDAQAGFSFPSVAQEGLVDVGYALTNTGQLDTRFTTMVTVTQAASVEATRLISAYLTAPGGVLTGTLNFDLDAGDYTLSFSNLFESGQVDFSVLGADRLLIRPLSGEISSDTLPFTATVSNIGYNHFTGTVRLEVSQVGGLQHAGTAQAGAPWGSFEVPISIETGGQAQQSLTLGAGASWSSFPFYNYYHSNRTQMLYLGSEAGVSGWINSLSFDIAWFTADPAYRNLQDLTIRLKMTSDDNWNSLNGYADMSGATTVFGPLDYTLPGAIGWVEFPIMPFFFDADQNLIVEVIWGDNGIGTSDYYWLYSTWYSDYRVIYGYSSDTFPPPYVSKSKYRPNLQLETGQALITGTVNTLAAAPGTQLATFHALNQQGQVVLTETLTFTLTAPSYDILSTPNVTATQVNAASNVTMTFGVENSGDLAGEASLTFSVGDIVDETKKAWLSGGETTQVDFTFYVNDDLASGQYLATYILTGTLDNSAEGGSFMVSVQGIDVTAETGMDQPYYAEGDPVHMIITLTNGPAQATPQLYLEASFEGQTITQPVQLDPGEQIAVPFDFTATFGGDNKVAYGVYNTQSQRAVLLDTAYLRQQQAGVTLLSDQEVYQPGDLVQVTIVTTATGSLLVEAPGYTAVIPLPATSFSFNLPGVMNQGTYAIYYLLQDCGCAGENEQHSLDFDVRSTEIRITNVQLGQNRYQDGDTVTALLNIASNQAISLTLESWLKYPDGSESAHASQAITLTDSLNNQASLSHLIASGQLGAHELVYRLFGPGSLLYDFEESPNTTETVYASGGKVFDVGDASLLGLNTDKPAYPTISEDVIVAMQVYGAVPTGGDLDLLLDGQAIWGEAVTIQSGAQTFTATLSGGLEAGWHTLTATLTVNAATSQRSSRFAYGTQIADLTVGGPWLVPTDTLTSQVIATWVTNQGMQTSGATTLEAYRGDPLAGGTLIGSASVPSLDPGASVEVQVAWDASGQGGDNDIYVWVNPNALVPEFYLDNNQGSAHLTLPRLSLATGLGQPAYAPGESVAIASQLQNMQGALGLNLTLTTTIRPALYGSSVIFTDTQAVSLLAGETRQLSLSWNSAAQPLDDYLVEQVAKDEYGSVYLGAAPFALDLSDLSTNLAITPAEVVSGDEIIYTVSFANNSPVPAANTTMTITLPDGVSYLGVITPTTLLEGPAQNGAMLIWAADSLAENTAGIVGVQVTVDATNLHTRPFTTTVEIGTSTSEASLEDNAALGVNRLWQYADLSLSMTNNQTEISAGDRLTYTLSYANAGLAIAEGTVVVDYLPAFANAVSCSTPTGGCEANGSVITFTLGNLGVSANGSLQIVAVVDDPLPEGESLFINNASIYALTPDEEGQNNIAQDVDALLPGAAPPPTIYLPLITRNSTSLNSPQPGESQPGIPPNPARPADSEENNGGKSPLPLKGKPSPRWRQ